MKHNMYGPKHKATYTFKTLRLERILEITHKTGRNLNFILGGMPFSCDSLSLP
jgi:hypothetical protein